MLAQWVPLCHKAGATTDIRFYCLQEWLHFVDREKELRMRISAQVDALAGESAQFQAGVLEQVEGMRAEMQQEVR